MKCGWSPLKSWGFLTCLNTGFILWLLVAFQWQIHSLDYVQGCTSRVSSGRTVVVSLFSVTQTHRHCIVTDKPWVKQLIALIYTTDKTIKTVGNENRAHNKLKNHSHQITLHSHIQYSGLIALTPGLEHSTSQIRFPRSTLCSSSAEFPLLSTVHSTRSAVHHTLWITVTRLSSSSHPMALYSAYCTPWTYFALLVIAGYP
jgi:hypothetical protein